MRRYEFLLQFGLNYKEIQQVTDIQVDSRRVQPGSLFFALKGAKVDGHQFLTQAQKRGAVAAVVSKKLKVPGLKLLYVENVLSTLHNMASLYIKGTKALVIAITGTVGKTTTKEMVATLLQSKYTVGKTFKNQNSQIGFPISLFNFQKNEDVYVLEMGMTQQGHIKNLCDIVSPDAALITKGTLVHAQNFQSLDEIVHAKAEVFSKSTTKIKVFDHDLYHFPIIKQIKNGISFSLTDSNADFYLNQQIVYEKNRRSYQIQPLFSESHFNHNLIGAIALCRTIGLSYEEINEQISEIRIPEMRFEKVKVGNVLFINDAYNASLDSMKAAISNLSHSGEGRKIGVLGSMTELGSFSQECHEELGKFALNYLDGVFCIGKECYPIVEMFQQKGKIGIFFEDIHTLAKQLKKFILKGDIVLIKASRSMQLEKLFELI